MRFTWHILIVSILLSGCSGENEKAPGVQRDISFNNRMDFPTDSGIIGVTNVPQMLCMSRLDSASAEHVAGKVAENYRILEEDLKACGAELDNYHGQINYNNDPKNFKFECILLIKDMPPSTPAHSKVVLLEASPMLVCNHYGPYQTLYKSYEKVRSYIEKRNLIVSGPLREFYITDPTMVDDSTKWLTRIFVPVTGF